MYITFLYTGFFISFIVTQLNPRRIWIWTFFYFRLFHTVTYQLMKLWKSKKIDENFISWYLHKLIRHKLIHFSKLKIKLKMTKKGFLIFFFIKSLMDMNHSSFRLSVTKHSESSDYPQILLQSGHSFQSSKSTLIFRVEVGSSSKVEFSGSTRVKLEVEIFLKWFLNFRKFYF